MKKNSKFWTIEELEILKEHYDLGPLEIIKLLPNRSYKSVVAKAHKLGLCDGYFWTDEEIEVLKQNYYDLGPHKLQFLLPNRTHMSIVDKGKKLGLVYKDNIMWTKEEIDILRQYYPTEGTKVEKRLNNISKTSILFTARYYGISFERKYETWNLTEDEIVYDFYLQHGSQSFSKIPELIDILKKKGFNTHGKGTLNYKLSNFKYLDTGVGLSHVSSQSRAVYEMKNKTKKVSPYLRQTGHL